MRINAMSYLDKPLPLLGGGDFGLDKDGSHGEVAVRTATTADEGVVTIGANNGQVSGVLDFAGDLDTINVDLVAGQTYLFSLRGTGDTPVADTFLYVYQNGAWVVADDDRGVDFDSLIGFTAATTGTYQLYAGAFDDAYTGGYTVDVRTVTTDQVPDDLATSVTATVGATTLGTIEAAGDVDVYAVQLTAGAVYEIRGDGASTYDQASASFTDALFADWTVYDAEGNIVSAENQYQFTVSADGTYFVAIDGSHLDYDYYTGYYYQHDTTGSYAFSVDQVGVGSTTPLDSIDWGSTVSSNAVSVYFAGAGEVFDDVESLGWSQYEIDRAMDAFQTFADISDLTFTITDDADAATFKLVTTESDDFLGYFNPPGEFNEGVGVFAVNGFGWDDDGGLERGGYGFITLIHEFGHGLGMAHPHDNGGTSTVMQGVTGPFGSYGVFDLNQGVYTTMSYNDGWQLHPDTVDGFPPDFPSDYGYQTVPMALDIAVIQQKYGADTDHAAGNDTYTLSDANAPGTYYSAIWDTGGTDAIVYNGARAARIDLTAATLDYTATGGGVVSYVGGIFGGYTIANGVVIENATGGSSNDVLIGNAADNVLNGRGGNDTMVGRAGNDTYYVGSAGDTVTEIAGEGTDTVNSSITFSLGSQYIETLRLTGSAAIDGNGNAIANAIYGNGAANVLNGGGGVDTLAGGAGNDRYIVDNVGDKVIEARDEGTDTVESAVTFSLIGQFVEVLRLTGNGAINATGNALANTIYGNGAANLIDGDRGADTMAGGAGNDRYIVDNSGDRVSEARDQGTDTVESAVTFSLAGQFVEMLKLTGSGVIAGTGNALDNNITGNAAANLIDGDRGADTLAGGAGNDRYIVDNAGDRVIEARDQGTDTIESSVSYSLIGQFVEVLKLTGSGAIAGTGNALANTIYGNGAANLIDGDRGADTLAGGAGNDRYIVDNTGDRVVEARNQGTDTVESAVTFSLAGQFVEVLKLTGAAATGATGNGLANTISGNAAANAIDGAGGGDLLSGGLGADTLIGGAGRDGFVFDSALGTGNFDRIFDFTAADDTIVLDRTVFAGLPNPGSTSDPLAAGAFVVGTVALDANDRIIYNAGNGGIYYDADGTGAAAQILFARLNVGTTLDASDFLIVP